MRKNIIIFSFLLMLSVLTGCYTSEIPLIGRYTYEVPQSFTIIVMPDTQKAVEKYPYVFTNQTEWIADNKDELNIKFVIHEGDIVDDWDSIIQWDNANKSMSILEENGIPYSVVPGNHDSPATYYKRYFPFSRFSDKEWWGDSYNNENSYQLMRINNEDYIFLGLDWCPDDDEIRWANNILEDYSKRKAILTTHGYLNENRGRKVHVCGNTEYIWKDLIQHHENLQIVLCGHVHDEAMRIDYNLAGKKVYQMLADYQDEKNGGNGWLRILKFVPSEDKIYIQTYSPFLDQYQTDVNSQFSVDYSFS